MKTKRSNIPEKRAHWKSARTERRGRFAHGDFEFVDQDLAYRSDPRFTSHGGRAMVNFSGHTTRVLWNTADKSRLKWKLGTGAINGRSAEQLRRTLHLRF